jgi:hypothetical protein
VPNPDYDDLGTECLERAEHIKDPELRSMYLNLAAGYSSLARFHERMRPALEMAEAAKEDD